jgi:hypothetical protein
MRSRWRRPPIGLGLAPRKPRQAAAREVIGEPYVRSGIAGADPCSTCHVMLRLHRSRSARATDLRLPLTSAGLVRPGREGSRRGRVSHGRTELAGETVRGPPDSPAGDGSPDARLVEREAGEPWARAHRRRRAPRRDLGRDAAAGQAGRRLSSSYRLAARVAAPPPGCQSRGHQTHPTRGHGRATMSQGRRIPPKRCAYATLC